MSRLVRQASDKQSLEIIIDKFNVSQPAPMGVEWVYHIAVDITELRDTVWHHTFIWTIHRAESSWRIWWVVSCDHVV